MIDWLLRLNILVLIYPPCSKSVVKRVLEKEDRFNRLVNYFDLVKPDNGISKRLLDFNNRRNRIIHKLFYAHPSFDSLEREIKSFSKEGIELEKNLKGFLDNFLSKV
jgi:hypothetical protein